MAERPPDRIPLRDSSAPSSELGSAIADVKRLRTETSEKADQLEQALERLRALTAADLDEARRLEAGADAAKPVARTSPPDDGLRRHPASEDLMLRAAQMALAGQPRSEIETALRERYGVQNPGALLDHILEPGR